MWMKVVRASVCVCVPVRVEREEVEAKEEIVANDR